MTQSSVEYLIKEFSEILGPISTNPMQNLLLMDAMKQAKVMHKKEQAEPSQLWIRPQDQMPKDGVEVLITDKEGLQIVAGYIAEYNMWYSENHCWFTHEVNYWMAIPEIV
jgi:hypothetical protein